MDVREALLYRKILGGGGVSQEQIDEIAVAIGIAVPSNVVAILNKLDEIIETSNATTGESDATLTDAVQSLIDGYGQGETPEVFSTSYYGAIYTRNFVMPDRESTPSTTSGFLYMGANEMETLTMGKNYRPGSNMFRQCTSLIRASVDSVTSGDMFWECTSLKVCLLQDNCTELAGYLFEACSSFDTLILTGSNVKTLTSINAFSGTKIKSSGGTGRIYVPSSMVDAYKSATNWSNFASSILSIEDNMDVVGDYL